MIKDVFIAVFPEAPGKPRIRVKNIAPHELDKYVGRRPILVAEDGEKPDELYVPTRRRSLPSGRWEITT